MDEWIPILIFPNLDIRGSLLCEHAAIVAMDDERMQPLLQAHPLLREFLLRFRSQFGQEVYPAILLIRAGSPQSYRTAEAVTGFRDVLSMSVVPYARAKRLRLNQPSALIFSSMFQCYPWMIDNQYETILLTNAAQLHQHLVEEFQGQTFPEQQQGAVFEYDIDLPVANALLSRWVTRFSDQPTDWQLRALFRSLNMANEAARVPAYTATTFYDVGRSLALWVSAYEILAHPGVGQSNFNTVAALIEGVQWIDAALGQTSYQVRHQQRPLVTWLYEQIYNLRNDFVHGNDVDSAAVMLNGKPTIDFAGCLYRLALTGFLSLHFDEVEPAQGSQQHQAFLARRTRFWGYQRSFEEAVRTAVTWTA